MNTRQQRTMAILLLAMSVGMSGCGPGQFLGPTVAPSPTATSRFPSPTATSRFTSTPLPTSTPKPTETPVLTVTPGASPTPVTSFEQVKDSRCGILVDIPLGFETYVTDDDWLTSYDPDYQQVPSFFIWVKCRDRIGTGRDAYFDQISAAILSLGAIEEDGTDVIRMPSLYALETPLKTENGDEYFHFVYAIDPPVGYGATVTDRKWVFTIVNVGSARTVIDVSFYTDANVDEALLFRIAKSIAPTK